MNLEASKDSNSIPVVQKINSIISNNNSDFILISDVQEKEEFLKMYKENLAYQKTIKYKEIWDVIVIYYICKSDNFLISEDNFIITKLNKDTWLVFVNKRFQERLEYFFVDLNLWKVIEAPKWLKYDSEKSNYSKNIYTFALSRFSDCPLYFLYRIDNWKFEQKTADYLNITDVFDGEKWMKLSIWKREYILSDGQISSLDKITELNQMEKLPTLKEIFIEYIKDVFLKNKK